MSSVNYVTFKLWIILNLLSFVSSNISSQRFVLHNALSISTTAANVREIASRSVIDCACECTSSTLCHRASYDRLTKRCRIFNEQTSRNCDVGLDVIQTSVFIKKVDDVNRDGRGYVYDTFNRYYRVSCSNFEISSRTHYYVAILLSGRIDRCLDDCNSDWLLFEGNCYFFGVSKLNWGDAQNDCNEKGSCLVTSQNERENKWLVDVIKNSDKNGEDFWIGANDKDIEDDWVWESNKSKLLFSDWHAGEPNNDNNEDCGTMRWHNSLYRWNDEKCQEIYLYICEK